MRISWKRSPAAVATAVLLAAGFVGAWPAAAQAAPFPAGVALPAGVTVAANGVIDFGFNLASLPGAEVATDQGTKRPDGGCLFEGHGVEQPASQARVLMIRTLSFDPASCTQRVARARYDVATMPASAAAVLAAGKPTGAGVKSRTEHSGKTPTGAQHAAATAGWFGYLRTNVAFNFMSGSLTSTESELDWYNDGFSFHTSIWSWSPDFQLTAWAPQFLTTGISAITNTLGFFTSVSSCMLGGLTTEHNPSYVEGFYNGGFGWGYRTATGGGPCALLASFSRDVFVLPIL